jgi:hypothetical protein
MLVVLLSADSIENKTKPQLEQQLESLEQSAKSLEHRAKSARFEEASIEEKQKKVQETKQLIADKCKEQVRRDKRARIAGVQRGCRGAKRLCSLRNLC